MSSGIKSNFGSFRIPGEAASKILHEKHGPEKKKKDGTLTCIIEEIKIGSQDSIGIAVNLLRFNRIEIPHSLNSLLELYRTTPRESRDAKFAEDAHLLQNQAINDIEELLK